MTTTTLGATVARTDWAPRALAALRIVAGLLFLAHGVVKLFGFPEGAAPGQQALFTLLGVGAVLELVGGALLIVGLFTRPTAFILSGMMAVAYFMFHAPASLYPVLNGGDAAILFSFIFLYLSASGPGAWSLDARAANRPNA
ncbi:MAG: DoxX family protein [Brevundimonas sp.]|nr:DoxX family protein [Brevundimonas sp.]